MCTVCGGAEADLPTHCPRSHLSYDQRMSVSAGLADFINGRWIEFYKYLVSFPSDGATLVIVAPNPGVAIEMWLACHGMMGYSELPTVVVYGGSHLKVDVSKNELLRTIPPNVWHDLHNHHTWC